MYRRCRTLQLQQGKRHKIRLEGRIERGVSRGFRKGYLVSSKRSGKNKGWKMNILVTIVLSIVGAAFSGFLYVLYRIVDDYRKGK